MLKLASPLWNRLVVASLVLSLGIGTGTLIGCHSMQTSAETDCQTGQPNCGAECDDDCNTACHVLPMDRYVRCLDERMTIHDAIGRANEAMRYDYNSKPSDDVIYGYQEAYIEIALGASGEVPPVPPERYWSTCYRTAEGHARAQDWFAGYAVGASRALASCRAQFNTVPSSGRSHFATDAAPSTVQGSPAYAGAPLPAW